MFFSGCVMPILRSKKMETGYHYMLWYPVIEKCLVFDFLFPSSGIQEKNETKSDENAHFFGKNKRIGIVGIYRLITIP